MRYIANRSSGKQGYAIARAAAALGAEVTLVSGPVTLPDPPGVKTVRVESAREMLGAVEAALPVDVGVFAAAVADWRTADAGAQKIKKDGSGPPQARAGRESRHPGDASPGCKTKRPKLVIGFAAETEKVIEHAKAKLKRKGCDWIVANDVSARRRRDGRRRQRGASRHRRTASSRGRRNRRTRSRRRWSRASRRR